MADDHAIPVGEKGLLEKKGFLSKAPFLVALSPASSPVSSPSPKPLATSAPPRGTRPRLAPDFSEKFEKEKLQTLKKSGVLGEEDALKVLGVLGEKPNIGLEQALHEVEKDLDQKTSRNLQVEEWKRIIKLGADQLVDEATAEANRWIDSALQQLLPSASSISKCIDDLLVKHFKAYSAQEKNRVVPPIRDYLTKVKNNKYGINSLQPTYYYGGLFCAEDTPGYTPKVQSTQTVLCSFLWSDTFADYPKLGALAQTLIHEALHRIEWWSDKAYDDNKQQYAKLTLKKALENPDSYAAFARDAVNCQ